MTNEDGEGVDGCMAKKALKTQGNPVGFKVERATGDIEFLFKLYRELNEKVDFNADVAYVAEAKVRGTLAAYDERIVALEYEGSDGGLSDEELNQMIEEAEKARPWYAKAGSWMSRNENGGAVLFIVGVSLILAGLLSLIVR